MEFRTVFLFGGTSVDGAINQQSFLGIGICMCHKIEYVVRNPSLFAHFPSA